ncbi:MAG: hypothetical protein WDA65_02315 [Christensenellales bacterium]
MGPQVKQCRICNKLFYSFGANNCPDCTERMERDFEKVRDYIYENPNANVVEISQETGVSEKVILSYLKEGRLTIAENNGMLLCEKCNRSISTGRYCKECSRMLEYDLRGAYVPPEERKQDGAKGLGKMHTDYYRK